MSFQEADTSYYFLNKKIVNIISAQSGRKGFYRSPCKNSFYLIDVLEFNTHYTAEKVTKSLDFMAEMILKNEQIYHYYSISERQWLSNGSLPDYANSAILFFKAAKKFQNKSYNEVAMKILSISKERFYDSEKMIFFDPTMDSLNDVEYLMEMNGLFAQMILDIEMKNGVKKNEYFDINQNL